MQASGFRIGATGLDIGDKDGLSADLVTVFRGLILALVRLNEATQPTNADAHQVRVKDDAALALLADAERDAFAHRGQLGVREKKRSAENPATVLKRQITPFLLFGSFHPAGWKVDSGNLIRLGIRLWRGDSHVQHPLHGHGMTGKRAYIWVGPNFERRLEQD